MYIFLLFIIVDITVYTLMLPNAMKLGEGWGTYRKRLCHYNWYRGQHFWLFQVCDKHEIKYGIQIKISSFLSLRDDISSSQQFHHKYEVSFGIFDDWIFLWLKKLTFYIYFWFYTLNEIKCAKYIVFKKNQSIEYFTYHIFAFQGFSQCFEYEHMVQEHDDP